MKHPRIPRRCLLLGHSVIGQEVVGDLFIRNIEAMCRRPGCEWVVTTSGRRAWLEVGTNGFGGVSLEVHYREGPGYGINEYRP